MVMTDPKHIEPLENLDPMVVTDASQHDKTVTYVDAEGNDRTMPYTTAERLALTAIGDSVRSRIHFLVDGISAGRIRNTAHTRGYIQALRDIWQVVDEPYSIRPRAAQRAAKAAAAAGESD